MSTMHRLSGVVVVTHWTVAVWHLFLAVRVLPAPSNHVSWLAITLISFGHIAILLVLWKLSDRVSGLISLLFFLAALGADLYEHFLHASLNNVLRVPSGEWTSLFDISVFILLALEIVGSVLGTRLLRGRMSRVSDAKVVHTQ